MLDNYKETQKIAYKVLKNALISDKISHAYLIETMGNKNGFDFAISFAKALLCPKKYTNDFNCNNCNQCKLIDDNNFIELEIIQTDQLWLKKENIDNLQKDFSFKPIIGHRKVYIINQADKIKENIANTLLKFIEEPEEGIIAILITENRNKIIETILSRCQIISLSPELSDELSNKINEYDKNIIDSVIKFINYYENNGKDSLIYSNDLLHKYLKDRVDYDIAFDIMIMYYNDVLNYKISKKILIFEQNKDNIIENFENLSVENIIKKIDILMKLRKSISNNVNLNLLIDKLILSFEKVNV